MSGPARRAGAARSGARARAVVAVAGAGPLVDEDGRQLILLRPRRRACVSGLAGQQRRQVQRQRERQLVRHLDLGEPLRGAAG
jgi:hypothetical protein